MNKSKSIYLNIMLNIIRTLLYVVFPIITFPYVSRVLGAYNLGKVNYSNSIVSYFSLFASLGIATYGVREGAKYRNNKIKLQKFTNEIFTVNIIMTLISYLLLVILITFTHSLKSYRLLILIQSISIILTTIGVDWLNSVFEDYLYITMRSFIVQIILLILLFVFVKTPNDYYKYAFLSVCSNGIVGIMNFFYTRKKYCSVKICIPYNFIYHIKKLLIFFANNLAINIYLNADVTMLGIFTNDYIVGIYSVAVKIYTVIKSLIAAMFTVCIPRFSFYFQRNKEKEYKYLLNEILNICTLIVFPIVAGLIVMAEPLVLILSGNEFISSVLTLRIISFGIIGAIYGGIMTNCINLPQNREKYNLNGTILAAIVNVLLNFILIPLFKECGAAITTVIAEFTVLIYCFITFKDIKRLLNIKLLVKSVFTGLIGMIIVFTVSFVIRIMFSNWIIQSAVMMILSVVIYIMLLCIIRNPYIKKIILFFRNKAI